MSDGIVGQMRSEGKLKESRNWSRNSRDPDWWMKRPSTTISELIQEDITREIDMNNDEFLETPHAKEYIDFLHDLLYKVDPNDKYNVFNAYGEVLEKDWDFADRVRIQNKKRTFGDKFQRYKNKVAQDKKFMIERIPLEQLKHWVGTRNRVSDGEYPQVKQALLHTKIKMLLWHPNDDGDGDNILKDTSKNNGGLIPLSERSNIVNIFIMDDDDDDKYSFLRTPAYNIDEATGTDDIKIGNTKISLDDAKKLIKENYTEIDFGDKETNMGGKRRKTRRNNRKVGKKSRKATKGKRKSRRKTSRRRARK